MRWLSVLYWLSLLVNGFVIPLLPISKGKALYPNCRLEVVFVLDVSGSVLASNQQLMMRFVTQFMIFAEQNSMDARYAAVVFGINGAGQAKTFNSTELGGKVIQAPPPYGNNKSTATELLFGLSSLKYGCTECQKVNASWSQLELSYTVGYSSFLSPTYDGLDFAKTEFDQRGDPTVSNRFVILITDGFPNDSSPNCITPITTPDVNATCQQQIQKLQPYLSALKGGASLFILGMTDDEYFQSYVTDWASDPKRVYAFPDANYITLPSLIPQLMATMCPVTAPKIPCYENETSVDIEGVGFLNTGLLACRYSQAVQTSTSVNHSVVGIYQNSTLITCPIPANFTSGTWNVEYTRDGRGYYVGSSFKYGSCHIITDSSASVLVAQFGLLSFFVLLFC